MERTGDEAEKTARSRVRFQTKDWKILSSYYERKVDIKRVFRKEKPNGFYSSEWPVAIALEQDGLIYAVASGSDYHYTTYNISTDVLSHLMAHPELLR
jgi:hypothetical protein